MNNQLISVVAVSLLITACKADEIKDEIVDQVLDEVVDYANELNETTSSIDEPVRVLPANPAGCPDWQKNQITEITESIVLPVGCRYDRVSLKITNKSNLTLDCNGAELNGLDKEFRQAVGDVYPVGRAPIDIGIQIHSSENTPSNNVTIKNCKLTNYVRGIRISFGISTANLYDLRNNVNVEALENYLRSVSPKNISVENSSINYSHRDGIFVGRYVTNFVLDNSTVKYTGSVGVYLDSGSQDNTIQNSTIGSNGHSKYNSAKRVRTTRLAVNAREGIAVDSSANNLITNNTFSSNSGGAVYIYKNCNENHTSASLIPRYQSADNNVIRDNQFNNENIGVWIASRQSKDLAGFNCGIPLVDTGTIKYGPVKETTKYYQDYAKNNQVLNNRFTDVDDGIIIEDDGSLIQSNIFSGSADTDIRVGTKYRTKKLLNPVKATTIRDNQFNTDAFPHIKLVYGPLNTDIKNNTPNDVNN